MKLKTCFAQTENRVELNLQHSANEINCDEFGRITMFESPFY